MALALAVGLGAYFLGAHSGSIATAQAPILWKVPSAWPPTSIVQDGAKLLVETIEKNSGGRLKLDLSPAGAVVPARDPGRRKPGCVGRWAHHPGYIIRKLKAFIP